MDEKKDRRIRKSKESLKKSFIELMKEKSVSNITVKELVAQADLNRSTFYNYYCDIPDMLEKLEMELYNEFVDIFKKHIQRHSEIEDISKDAHEFIEDMCNVIKNNYSFCYCIFSKNGDLSFIFKLEEMVEKHLRDQLKEKFNRKSNNLSYIYSFFKSGYIGILKKWMEGGCKESSSEIADLTYNLLKGVVDTCKKQLRI